jgi:cell division protein FtsW (lipid II flippase)
MGSARHQERVLLLIVGLVVLCGIFSVTLPTHHISYQDILPAMLVILGWVGVSYFLQIRHAAGDPLLLPLSALLSGIGLIMILRLKPELYLMQVIWNFVGMAAFLGTVYYCRRIEELANYKYLCGMIGVALLLLAIVFGVDIGGHKSWVIIGPVRFQPSEFAKLFIVLFLAGYLSEQRQLLVQTAKRYGPVAIPQFRFIAPLLTVWGLTMVMFVLQRDLGSALMFFGIVVLMIYMVNGEFSIIAMGTLLFFVGSAACYKFYSHIRIRVDIWLNPWADPNGKAYQIVQSLFAIGSGRILGSGLTYGFPTMIPEVHTDFIFAAIAEELGFIGAGAVLLLYILLVYRAYRISLHAKSSFSMLAGGGLATILALQIFFIVGGVSKFFPLTGITLPFVSYGGSSILANFIFVGMLFAISKEESQYAK